ncbi:MAG: N-acetylmuramoyl-L-alanine amidase [Desulfotignum sp.]|nr:N-acetylmuramoyl-L-alanine amidase [Desulfotignum sp.]
MKRQVRTKVIHTENCFSGSALVFGLVFFMACFFVPATGSAINRTDYQRFQAEIIDHRHRLNRAFKKIRRAETRYIIVHTSELGLSATLRVVSEGKRFSSGHSTPGGHANYVVARNGDTYRILDKQFRADHAGLSMWQGRQDISSVSIGIELVGYHSAPLTDQQYRSVAMLIDILQNVYSLDDKAVLTHSQVAFGRPNPWFPKNHRGRKRCAKNFDRSRAGLGPGFAFDPDVRAERLLSDPYLADLFYSPKPAVAARVPATGPVSNLISRKNSAWAIAGEDYSSKSTVYILPNGRKLTGDQIDDTVGWHLLPVNTRVLLNQETQTEKILDPGSPVKIITDRMTAWSHAGPAYGFDSTIYFLPSGRVYTGSFISDWDDLPQNTRLIVGYQGPFFITGEKTAYGIAGQKFKDRATVYFLPPGHVKTGDKITDFSSLPRGSRIYLPLDNLVPG